MATTQVFPIKCIGCGLHFTVYSWDGDWMRDRKIFCPECGNEGGKIVWHEESELQIFELVPGFARIIGRLPF